MLTVDSQCVLLFEYHGMLWTRCKMRREMPGYYGGTVKPGKIGYRPLTNGKLRMMRLAHVPSTAIVLTSNTGRPPC
jgi:hypothetical protein